MTEITLEQAISGIKRHIEGNDIIPVLHFSSHEDRELAITKYNIDDVIAKLTEFKHCIGKIEKSIRGAIYADYNIEIRQPGKVADALIRLSAKNIQDCEDPEKRIISKCEIKKNRHKNEVWITSDHDGFAEDYKMLFNYYPDELSFSESEFIGRSEAYAERLRTKRDIEYLRS